ncbi:MAG: hypothetical protein ACRENK_07080 [Gemmatimonadaceae bacterium]
MPDYSIFGECLRSDLPFSDLRPAVGATPRWTLRLTSDATEREGDVIGEMLNPPCAIRLRKNDKNFRLSHSCTGEYDVSRDGSQITCAPLPAAEYESLRYDIANRVMAIALHAEGALCLHGSAVKLRDGVIGFLAPKGYGKSTLASALLRAGSHLVTDDMLVIELRPRPMALPGIFGLRLRDDSAERLLTGDFQSRRGVDGKHVIDGLDDDCVMLSKAPLSAIYVLCPVAFTPGARVLKRTNLSPRKAAIELITHNRIATLLGATEALLLLDRATSLAKEVPVFHLEVARNLEHLDGVVDQLLEWHGAPFRPELLAV